MKIVAVAGLTFGLASCTSASDPYANSYPANTNRGTVFRAPDGVIYRQGDVYRDRNGNVYQNGRVIRTGDVHGRPGVLGRNGDNTVYDPGANRRNLPPYQAKKIYRGKAKNYAKNQWKKRHKDWDDDDDRWDDDDDHEWKKNKKWKEEQKWRKYKSKGYKYGQKNKVRKDDDD